MRSPPASARRQAGSVRMQPDGLPRSLLGMSRLLSWCLLASCVLMTGCGGPANAAKPLQPRAGCLLSLQMITSTTGWAMPCTGKPGSAGARVARTTDGGRTWRDVTPSPVRALSAPNLSVVLLAADERHAWLAESTYPHAAVYRTADGGRTWNRSALPDAAGYVRLLGHAGLDHA